MTRAGCGPRHRGGHRWSSWSLAAGRRRSSCSRRRRATTKTVTAHFPRAVSVYEGTEVRILGVNVGKVTAVIPEGNTVRVEMEYDAEYEVPADAKAVIVTPTLVADRFVQLTPAYTEGDEVWRTAPTSRCRTPACRSSWTGSTPACEDLTGALGPNGVNKDGTLDHFSSAGARAPRGQGRAGQRDDPQPVGGGEDLRRGQRRPVRDRELSWPSSPRRWPRTTPWSARSCRTWPAVSAALAGESDGADRGARRGGRARSARSRRSCRTTARRSSPTSRS